MVIVDECMIKIILLILFIVYKNIAERQRVRVFDRVCCVGVRYWLTALSSLGFRFRKRRRPAAEGRDEIRITGRRECRWRRRERRPTVLPRRRRCRHPVFAAS